MKNLVLALGAISALAVTAAQAQTVVTDTDGNTDETSEEVIVAAGLEVNSTADRPAEDPAEKGCDTGELVDDVPECTLRAAIETANELGGGEITFAIEGAGTPTIAATRSMPVTAASS